MNILSKRPVVYGKVVGEALKLEAQLIAQDRIQEFAKEQADVLKVLMLADLNTLDPYVTASIIKKKNVDYINFAELSSATLFVTLIVLNLEKNGFWSFLSLTKALPKNC